MVEESPLDDLYTTVARTTLEQMHPQLYKKLLGALLFANEALDISSLGLVSGASTDEVLQFIERICLFKVSDGKVSPMHKHEKEFFTGSRCPKDIAINSEEAQLMLSAVCLDVLVAQLRQLEQTEQLQLLTGHQGTLGVSQPFVRYAAAHWMEHLDLDMLTPNFEEFAFEFGPIALAAAIHHANEPLFLKLVNGLNVPIKLLISLNPFASPVLFEAARQGLAQVCNSLLTSNLVDVNCIVVSPDDDTGTAASGFGQTPLHVAVKAKSLETVKVLINFGADMNAKDEFDVTPFDASEGLIYQFLNNFKRQKDLEEISETMTALQLAVWKKDLDGVKSHIFTPLFFRKNPEDGSTALHYAAEFYDASIFKTFLNHNRLPEILHERNQFGNEPIHAAAQYGHADAVWLLIEEGSGVDSLSSLGATPLHIASEQGWADVIQVLVEKGAALDARTDNQWTALHLAVVNEHVDAARVLINAGANVDAADVGGWTPLHWGTLKGHVEVCGVLLNINKNGKGSANVEARTVDSKTPLHVAGEYGHLQLVQLLVEQGNASVHAVDAELWTPLHSATQNGHLQVAKYLLEKGANVDSGTSDQTTCLILASQIGLVEAIQLLLEREANVDAADSEGWTGLMWAACEGHMEAVRVLVEVGGAYLNAVANDLSTPLHLAAQNGHEEITKFLVEKGARVNAVNLAGQTPLQVAEQEGHNGVVASMPKRRTVRGKIVWKRKKVFKDS